MSLKLIKKSHYNDFKINKIYMKITFKHIQ